MLQLPISETHWNYPDGSNPVVVLESFVNAEDDVPYVRFNSEKGTCLLPYSAFKTRYVQADNFATRPGMTFGIDKQKLAKAAKFIEECKTNHLAKIRTNCPQCQKRRQQKKGYCEFHQELPTKSPIGFTGITQFRFTPTPYGLDCAVAYTPTGRTLEFSDFGNQIWVSTPDKSKIQD